MAWTALQSFMRIYGPHIDRQVATMLVGSAARKHQVAMFDLQYQYPKATFKHAYLHLGLVDCHIPVAQNVLSEAYLPIVKQELSRRPHCVNVAMRLVVQREGGWVPLMYCYHVLRELREAKGTLGEAWDNMDSVILTRRRQERGIREEKHP